ncbi:bifunctional 26S Proteasome non-ATPase regulatory subunit 6/Winged helix DNA-binding domain superfamily/Proteasome component (PCI) domain/26S proteasome regulatory subunit Rpn7 [Babesia duncani]|uniref:Bifunctional 26S Proteasome non-ATPase regulatory subunit 6/Winged helix DNA-binding domain superfamily/Proteasome component (PCI) domain/26S proteasome regulatory subunit Rpn7 n=1 Tax=Babesia duncani TaxID=323732 RepID=A0AAD9PP13_9APIC|nr:bifunctional 26S Proteasome non-ATPase regulatory subunit 6/Winged helix DNA-binding domain superfamily/Proteasome component (PCI) domain/26S proteasome regulatory subunit Rpn7 [Babesia duncani]
MAFAASGKDNAATAALKSLPNFEIEKLRHLLTLTKDVGVDYDGCMKSLIALIKENEMYPYYERIKGQFGGLLEYPELQELKQLNDKMIAELDEKIENAEKNFGSSEVKDCILEKANYYFKIGDHQKAAAEYELALSKTVGVNSKLEIILGIMRVAFFFNDVPLLLKYMEKAKQDVDRGGDWELRNRLHVYEGVQLILCRKFKEAATLFLKSLSTFTAVELISLEEVVLYSIVLSLLTLDRATIRKQLLESPEVNQVAVHGSPLKALLHDLYHSNYSTFLYNLSKTSELVLKDRYLAPHCNYIVRQGRLPAYAQFLRPYKSVTLKNMADAFQVPVDFMENELVSYISGMRLDCKIDKVNGIIENNVIDERNNNYINTIKKGDVLINRIQKLARIIDM